MRNNGVSSQHSALRRPATRRIFSIVVLIVVLSVLIFVDRVNQQRFERETRDLVSHALLDTEFELNSSILETLQKSKALASLVSDLGTVDQVKFDLLASRTLSGNNEILRAEFAPDLVTTIVFPSAGNEDRIGKSPILENEGTVSGTTDNLVAALSERTRLVPPLTVEVAAPVQILQARNQTIEHFGLLHVVFRVNLDPPTQFDRLPGTEIEYLLLESQNDARAALPEGWLQTEANIAPLRVDMPVPGNRFALLARPMGGWSPNAAQMLKTRLPLIALAMFVTFAIGVANWFIGQRARARDKMLETESKLSDVLEYLQGSAFTFTMPAGHVSPGAGDTITFFNKHSTQQIWGIDAARAEGNVTLLWEAIDDPDIRAELANEISAAAAELRPWNGVWPIRTTQGQRKWLEGKGYPALQPDGSIEFFGLITDTTERVERQQQLEQQKDARNRSQNLEQIGQLTGGVAHDFNNILSVILGSLELLRDHISTDRQIRLVDSSINAAQRAADLTKSMLAFAQEARLDPQVVDLNKLVNATRGWAGRTFPANIEIETSLLAGLWAVKVDPASTESSMLNLMLNARDSMPDGGKMTIETSNVRIDKPYVDARDVELSTGRYVMLAVSDTGCGIEAEQLYKVFEPFFTTKAPGLGSGLGLSMIQGFMHQSGGTVQIYSEPGVGTSVKLYFPALTGEIPKIDDVSTDLKPASKDQQRILVAEDENDVRRVLVEILEIAGYLVTQAQNGDQAKEIFDADPDFDLLITDIVMPGTLQGTLLSRVLRQTVPDLPVIFMSGYASEAAIHGNGLRPEDVRLMKPVQRVELLKAVSIAIEQKHRPD